MLLPLVAAMKREMEGGANSILLITSQFVSDDSASPSFNFHPVPLQRFPHRVLSCAFFVVHTVRWFVTKKNNKIK